MATLFNTKISDTYEGLIKTSDNGVIGAVEKNLTDGLGNTSTLSIGTSSASFTGTLDLTNATVVGLPSGAVDSVNGQTGVVVLTTTDINEGTNLYFTDARVEANSAVTLNTAKASFPEAPNDGQQYARQSQGWSVVSGGGAVSSVTGSGTVSGLTLTTGGTSTDPILTLGGTLSLTSANVTDALTFTPYNATNPAGYITTYTVTSGDVTSALGFTPYSDANPNNYISTYTVTNSDVITALGFTPYNNTNPSNFTSNLGIVQSVTGNAGTLEIVSGVLNVPPSGSAPVDSVNGETGVVVLDTDDIAEGTTNKYMVLGTTATTALAGNTSLLQLGTTSTTALAGDTTIITSTSPTINTVPKYDSNGNLVNSSIVNSSSQISMNIYTYFDNEIEVNGQATFADYVDFQGTTSLDSAIALNTAKISFTSTGTDNYLSKWSSNTLIDSLIYDNGTNVGIGTTTPSDKLSVVSTVGILGDSTDQGLLKLYCEDSSHYVGIQGPNHSGGSSYTLQLPNALPNVANQILESNATGTLSWIATPSGGGGGATDLNGLSDVLIDGSSSYFVNIPSSLSGNPTDNLVIGDNAGNSLTTGKRNVILGSQAAPATTSGSYQVIIGWNAGLNTTSNGSSVIIGYDAGKLVNANSSVIIGSKAARNLSGAYGHSTIVGTSACNQTSSGNDHCAFGSSALFFQTTGDRQTAIGFRSLYSLSTANDNTALGYQSGYSITGSGNTVIGSKSAYSGTNNLTSGSNNILIGHNSSASAATVSNEITLGNSSISTLRCAVTSITSLSDERDKSNIKNLSYGLDFIDSLQPREFVWDNRVETKLQQVKDENGDDVFDENNEGVFEEVEFYSNNKGKKDFGFIAQEVQSLDDDTLRLVYDKNPEKLEISYGKLVPILVKAIQELKAEIETLK